MALQGLRGLPALVTRLAGGIAMVLRAMPEEKRGAVRALVERAMADFRAIGGVELPGVALNASAPCARRTRAGSCMKS